MLNIGLSSCGKELNAELFRSYSESGIKCIEISAGRAEYANSLNWKEIKVLSDMYGVDLWSFHIPFLPFDEIDISNPNLADYTVEYFCKLIEYASEIGIRRFVINPSGEPIREGRDERMACAKESLRRLADFAEKFGAVICVEDLPRTCLGRDSSEILELVSAHPSLKICFDTNHLLSETNEEFVKKVGDKIETLHVSDYDFLNERHWLPGEGLVDWTALYSSLIKAGYRGAWLYELGFATPQSIVRERVLTCADFANNAKEIFSDSEITVLGKSVEGLVAWDA